MARSEISRKQQRLTQGKSVPAPMRINVHRKLLERIVCGDLAPGARIKELELSETLGVSRTPIREALLRLEREGFVRSELAHGFSVEPLSAREIRESYPVIAALEELALRISAPVLASLVEQLTELNVRLATNAESDYASECAIDYDTRWHETLISGCPNRRLHQITAEVRSTLRRYERFYMMDSALITESAKQHIKVIDAIVARDIEAAVSALADNWRFGMDTLLLRIGAP